MKKVRVLSIDGGGIRGIIPAYVLMKVEKILQTKTGNKNARIADLFDIIAGTSTGGILTCFYLCPNPKNPEHSKLKPLSAYTAKKALDFYVENGTDIFNNSKYFNWFGLRQLFDATQFSPKKLEALAREVFGDLKLEKLLKHCLVTTYNMRSRSSFFFCNHEPPEKKRDFYVRDVVRSTSAAPTYFPPARIRNLADNNELMVNIDGGVFANNPTMCGYAECRKTTFEQIDKPNASEMLVLSLGTGAGHLDLPDLNTSRHWNVIEWAKSIPNIMMDGSVDTVAYQMHNLFNASNTKQKSNYKRVDFPKDQKKPYAANMANASKKNIDNLLKAGKITLENAQKRSDSEYSLDEFIQLLIDNAPSSLSEK